LIDATTTTATLLTTELAQAQMQVFLAYPATVVAAM
jgi:hypothetical protein